MSEAAILEKESQTVKQTDLITFEQFPTHAVVKIQLGANCSALKTGKENGSVRENEQNQ